MKTGLVLSGGGARAFMHLGVIQALNEYGITIDFICGTSAGALVGALYAGGYTPEESLDILSESGLFRSVRFAFGRPGLLRISAMEKILSGYFPENDFSALKIPLTITATDIMAAETVAFDSGEVVQPMIASCGIPGLFEPYRYQGRELVDGGVLNNMPVEYLKGKTDQVVGAHCNPFFQDRPLKNSFEVAYRSLLLAVHNQNIERLQKCDLLIEPPGMRAFSIFDFHKAKSIFRTGYDFTRRLLSEGPHSLLRTEH